MIRKILMSAAMAMLGMVAMATTTNIVNVSAAGGTVDSPEMAKSGDGSWSFTASGKPDWVNSAVLHAYDQSFNVTLNAGPSTFSMNYRWYYSIDVLENTGSGRSCDFNITDSNGTVVHIVRVVQAGFASSGGGDDNVGGGDDDNDGEDSNQSGSELSLSFGHGKVSTFTTDEGCKAVVVGVAGLNASVFKDKDWYGSTSFVHQNIIDGEKTATDDDDDYWCGPITDMNMLYLTGWASLTSYSTIDDMIGYFRNNKTLLRYAATPGVIESVVDGKYGYDGLFRWFKDTTKQDLTAFVRSGYITSDFADTLSNLMDNGENVLHVDVMFYGVQKNPKWKGESVSHAVTCCGYEADGSELTALYIIDSDNDQYDDVGGASAPNSIIRCPVVWDDGLECFQIDGIWGESAYLLNEYTALKTYRPDEVIVAFDAAGGEECEYQSYVVGEAYGELPETWREGYTFEGWYTRSSGGTKVTATTVAQKTVTKLYAKWAKIALRKVTVSGGFILTDDGYVTQLGNLMPGETGVSIEADYSKGYFQYWTVTPANVDLGSDFNQLWSELYFTMPNTDVKLTAKTIKKVDGWLWPEYDFITADPEYEGDLPYEKIYWSLDKGKTRFKFGSGMFPLAAGTYTINFYCDSPDWIVPSSIKFTVPKFVAADEEQEAPYFYKYVSFVEANGAKKLRLDPNGGKISSSDLYYHDHRIGYLPEPEERKGYVFCGWGTQKNGGMRLCGGECATDYFEYDEDKVLYAQWSKLCKVTLKDADVSLDWYLSSDFYPVDERYTNGGYLMGKGSIEIPSGAFVSIYAPETSPDKKGNELQFQKWTISPSKVSMGQEFFAGSFNTSFTMPEENLTISATYIDPAVCGWLYASAYAESVLIDESGDSYEPNFQSFEWSPDSGKTWYKIGESALLKAGSYTVSWRSIDSNWEPVSDKTKNKITVRVDDESNVDNEFRFVNIIKPEIYTVDDPYTCWADDDGGTVTMNPKDGRLLSGKTVTLTAKANKGYVFQGWIKRDWNYGSVAEQVEYAYYYSYSTTLKISSDEWLEINADLTSSFVAVFKSVNAYTPDDIVFYGLYGWGSGYDVNYDDEGNAYVTIEGRAGCEFDGGAYEIDISGACQPIKYSMSGKLPKGLKFDAKKGSFSGVPTDVNGEKKTVIVTATDPAKNQRTLEVTIDVKPLPEWVAGNYRVLQDEVVNELNSNGGICGDGEGGQYMKSSLLEVSIAKNGKVSGKLLSRLGAFSASGNLRFVPEDDGDGYYYFDKESNKGYMYFDLYPDGEIYGWSDAYESEENRVYSSGTEGMRQNQELLEDCQYLNQYYTVTIGRVFESDDENSVDPSKQNGYGYLTIKTDKKGGAKIVGKLPDGQAVSGNALLMPWEDDNGEVYAKLMYYYSPSAYKKNGGFAVEIDLAPDGSVSVNDGAWQYPVEEAGECEDGEYADKGWYYVTGFGGLYSAASSLEDFYFDIGCMASEVVKYYVNYKEDGWEWVEEQYAKQFDDKFSAALLKGDNKGGISLAVKSPAPWNDNGEWNYWEDKKGNEITDPSQLSFSFAKATGIFKGKFNVYFDYWDMKDKPVHKAVSVPYEGIIHVRENDNAPLGLASAVYTTKYSYLDECTGKRANKTYTVSLPVIIEGIDTDGVLVGE